MRENNISVYTGVTVPGYLIKSNLQSNAIIAPNGSSFKLTLGDGGIMGRDLYPKGGTNPIG